MSMMLRKMRWRMRMSREDDVDIDEEEERRRKMMMLKRKIHPKTWNHTLCKQHAHGHFTRATCIQIYRKMAENTSRDMVLCEPV